MTRKRIAVAVVLLIIATAVAFLVTSREPHDHEDAIFYCPMHPTITSDRPKNCPICGMKLVRKDVDTTGGAATSIAESARMGGSSATTETAANVRTERVSSGSIAVPIVANGRVAVDERRMSVVASYTAGRVEQLYANFVGDSVRRGGAVATIYSPELFAAQQEYLVALRNRERMRNSGYAQAGAAADDLVESAARKLQLLGLSRQDLRRIGQGRGAIQNVTITSPVTGVVTRKLVVPQQYVSAGQPLLEVSDLSVVWIVADVFEQAIGNVTPGLPVTVTIPALPAVEFSGRVAFVQPTLSGATRSVQVRIELPNPQMMLKPEMFANVRFTPAQSTARLNVSASAIVDRGTEQFVWVETSPGRFAPRRVVAGARAGDRIEIVSGLTAGEVVVTNGAFLVDSEAQLDSTTVGEAR